MVMSDFRLDFSLYFDTFRVRLQEVMFDSTYDIETYLENHSTLLTNSKIYIKNYYFLKICIRTSAKTSAKNIRKFIVRNISSLLAYKDAQK